MGEKRLAEINGREMEGKKKIKTNAQALGTVETATFCVCASFQACAGNGNFWKCKSVGLKIQHINALHMWLSGKGKHILTAGKGMRERGKQGGSGLRGFLLQGV